MITEESRNARTIDRWRVCVYIYSLHAPCRICTVKNCNKIRGIMKIACYCLFNTVLDKLFHITDVYIFSTRQNNWIYKKWHRSKVYTPLNLNNLCRFLMIHDYFCVVIVVHESLVCSEQLNWAVLQKNPPAPAQSLVFQHLLHIWTLSNSDCMILRSIFSHWGTHTQLLYKVDTYWCSWRQHNALRAGAWKLFELDDQGKLYLFCLLGNI